MTDLSDDEAFAAEYVLGTLDRAERTTAETRRSADPAFDTFVREWEARLTPLSVATPEAAPPQHLLAVILSRLNLSAATEVGGGNVVQLRRRIRIWQTVATAAGAVAAALAVWIAYEGGGQNIPAANGNYVAVLQQGSGSPSFVVSVNLAERRMTVMPLDTTPPPGKSYELWMIGNDKSGPHSLGVVSDTATRATLPPSDKSLISQATYAVTVEPLGGSPSGKPSGAPVFSGKLLNLGG